MHTDANEPFDFTKFLDSTLNPDDDARRAAQNSAVEAEMDSVMGEVAPRLWEILRTEMAKDVQNNVRHNAIMNAAIFSLFSWIAGTTPKGETSGRDNDQILVDLITNNLKLALANRSEENATQMVGIAMTVGRPKLLEDSLTGITAALNMNSQVLESLAEQLKKLQ